MPDYQRIQTLYSSGLIKVFDVCCRAECRTCSAEEYASGHLLVIPRAGVCVQHRSRREEIVTDPTRLLFFNRDEPCSFSHPVPGGDDCTAIAFEETKLHAFLCANDPTTMDRLPQKPFQRPTAAASATTTLLLQRLRQHLFLGSTSNALVVEETAAHLLAASLRAAGTLAPEAGTPDGHPDCAPRTGSGSTPDFSGKVPRAIELECLGQGSVQFSFPPGEGLSPRNEPEHSWLCSALAFASLARTCGLETCRGSHGAGT